MNTHPRLEGHHHQNERDGRTLVYRNGIGWQAEALDTILSLDADAATVLDISGNEIGLDTQTANTVFAGPTSGGANEPTFRALVDADLPAHGAAEHDNRTRSEWMYPNDFLVGETGPDLAIRGSTANAYEKVPAWAFDAAAFESIVGLVNLPTDWDSGSVTVKLEWMPATTNTGDVAWQVLIASIEAATQYDQGLEHNLTVNQAGSGTAENRHEATVGSFTPASSHLRVTVRRQGGDAADTFTGDAWFTALKFEYGADM